LALKMHTLESYSLSPKNAVTVSPVPSSETKVDQTSIASPKVTVKDLENCLPEKKKTERLPISDKAVRFLNSLQGSKDQTTRDDFDLASHLERERCKKHGLKFEPKRWMHSLADEVVRKTKAFTGAEHIPDKAELTQNFEKLKQALQSLPSVYEERWYRELQEEQADMWKTVVNSFPQRWLYLLSIRNHIYLSGAGKGGHDIPFYARDLQKAWNTIPDFCPQGANLCVIGWEGLLRECSMRQPLLRPTFMHADPETFTRRGRVPKYLVGPLPHANGLGLFFNEMWLPEHYEELCNKGWYPKECFGEFCLYEKLRRGAIGRLVNNVWSAGKRFWKVPSRYSFEMIVRQLGLESWWAFNKAEKVVVWVDSWPEHVFTTGATLHDGGYVTACRRLEEQGFSYTKYWTFVTHGTVTYYGQKVSGDNMLLWTARCTDQEFKTFVSSWLGNVRIADRLYHTFLRQEGGQEKPISHPFNPFNGNSDPHNSTLSRDLRTGPEARSMLKTDMAMARREVDARLAQMPILTCFTAAGVTTQNKAMGDVLAARAGVINLGSPESEWKRSSISVWPVEDWTTMSSSCYSEIRHTATGAFPCPVVTQMNLTAIQDEQICSIYNIPKYDTNRIEVRWELPYDSAAIPWSKARPELLYFCHFGDLYLPSPHASLWTVLFRCGKSIPDFSGVHDEAFRKFSRSVFFEWNLAYNPRSAGLDSVEIQDFLDTIKKMNPASRRKRLEWFLSFVAGSKKVTSKTMKFFAKTDEELFMNQAERGELLGLESFTPAGKPRSIFNAADVVFACTQPELSALKGVVKENLEESNINLAGYEVAMPRVLHHTFSTSQGIYQVFLRYMADSDNIQDAAWISEAWKGREREIYIAVGGDDNATVLFYQGHRIELEGDLSMCDQSMRALFADIFCEFLRKTDVPQEVVNMVAETYKQPATWFVGTEKICDIIFKEQQLKTGVAHTSFSNTFIVGLLIIFGLENNIRWLDKNNGMFEPSSFQKGLIEGWREMGITMKLKMFVDSEAPLLTFHKRYFVPLERDSTAFTACPLPSTTVKMCAVRAPTLMKPSTFWKRLRESARSRENSSHNPITRKFINGILYSRPKHVNTWIDGIQEKLIKIDANPETHFGGNVANINWYQMEGDGVPSSHRDFCIAHYGFTEEEYNIVLTEIDRLDFSQCHRLADSQLGILMWRIFSLDYG